MQFTIENIILSEKTSESLFREMKDVYEDFRAGGVELYVGEFDEHNAQEILSNFHIVKHEDGITGITDKEEKWSFILNNE